MPEANAGSILLTVLGTLGVGQVLLETVKWLLNRRKEASALEQAEDQAPLIQESLALGNFEKAIVMQQQVIDRQQKTIEWQAGRISSLQDQLQDKEDRIRLLEQTVNATRRALADANDKLSRVEREIQNLKETSS